MALLITNFSFQEESTGAASEGNQSPGHYRGIDSAATAMLKWAAGTS
jgi:hypothetical protein